MYIKLASREEREVLKEFGEEYRHYMDSTPAFIPRIGRHRRMREV
jgi:protein-S-isoprenylcysteine O-methyltransferase Ste14